MAIAALAKSLLYFFGATSPNDTSPFQCPPWAYPVWREVFGLAPLRLDDEEADDLVDVDSEFGSQRYARAEDGFAFSREALSSLTDSKAAVLTEPTRMRAEAFTNYFWEMRCQDAANCKPIAFTVASLPKDPGNSPPMMERGYGQYRDVVLTMLNRPGGVLSQVEEVMVRLRATLAEKWKDLRDADRRRGDRRMYQDEYDVPFPTGKSVCDRPDVLAATGLRLLGDGAVDRGGDLLPEFQKTVILLLYRKFESLYRRLKNLRTRSRKQQSQFDASLKVACEKRTPAALRDVSQALVAWRRTAQESLQFDDPPFLEREKQLKELWAELGFEAEAEVGVGKKSKAPSKAKSTLGIASDAEMQAAFQYYVEDYCNSIETNDDVVVPIERPVGMHDLAEGQADIGVDHIKDWEAERVWESLGLLGATQFPFGEPGTELPEGLSHLAKAKAEPRWHQVVGVHAILERAFTRSLGERGLPTLLCDDVGLGKTMQIIGVFSWLSHLYEQQTLAKDRRLPPPPFTIVNETPYFDGLESVPKLPSLIVLPRSLSAQWLDQLILFTQRGSFAIVRYTRENGSLENFSSDPAGLYRLAAGLKLERCHKVIVLADQSAVAIEAKRCLAPPATFFRGKAAQLQEAKGEPSAFRPGVSTGGSLLNMRFRVVAIDEAHNLRNCGYAHQGILKITSNSHLVIGATATPLFTGPKDLAAQGRILRFPPMIGENGLALCKEVMHSMHERAKEWGANNQKIMEEVIQREARQAATAAGFGINDPRFKKLREGLELKYQSEDQISIQRMKYVSQRAMDILRQTMRPVLVRRTAKSRDPSGNLVLELKPFTFITTWCPLSDVEQEALCRVNEQHRMSRLSPSERKVAQSHIKWTNFLLDQKHAGLHPLILTLRQHEKDLNLKEGTLLSRLAEDWDDKNFEENASTRLLKIDEVLRHFWVGNPKPPIFKEDGTRDHEAPVDEPLPSKESRKFLIYVAYRYHRDLIAKMLQIEGRDFVTYDGSMTLKQRTDSVHRFNNDPQCRIMIISNVGSAGLNLTAASVLIFVSRVWSGQEKWQIIGRLWRYGQLRDVVIMELVAPGGIDLALQGYADGKTSLADIFLMSEAQLRRAYLQVTAPDEDNGEEIEHPENANEPAPQCAAKTSRKRKNSTKVPSEEGRSDGVENDEDANKESADEDLAGGSRPAKRAKTSKKTDGQTLGAGTSKKKAGQQKTKRATTSERPATISGIPQAPGRGEDQPTVDNSGLQRRRETSKPQERAAAPVSSQHQTGGATQSTGPAKRKIEDQPTVDNSDLQRRRETSKLQERAAAPVSSQHQTGGATQSTGPAKRKIAQAARMGQEQTTNLTGMGESASALDVLRPSTNPQAPTVKHPAAELQQPSLNFEFTDQSRPNNSVRPKPKIVTQPAASSHSTGLDLFDLSRQDRSPRLERDGGDAPPGKGPSTSLDASTTPKAGGGSKKRSGFAVPNAQKSAGGLAGKVTQGSSLSAAQHEKHSKLVAHLLSGDDPQSAKPTLRLSATVSSKGKGATGRSVQPS